MTGRVFALSLLPFLFDLCAHQALAQQGRPLELRDMFTLQRISTPALSPDGKQVAYTVTTPNLYADNFSTPTLVISGAYDFRIPYTESMALFTALQRRSVPSTFVFFPDEGHWVSKPANSEFWHRTVFGWLNRYLSP